MRIAFLEFSYFLLQDTSVSRKFSITMEKFLVLVTVLSICALAAGYTDMDDSVNVEAVAKDKPRLQLYLNCFLNRSPCTTQMIPYKKHLMEAITDGCKECNDRERHMMKIFIQTIKGLKNGDYEMLRALYDPNNHMEATFAEVARF